MTKFDVAKAREAAAGLPHISRMIVESGQERLRALQTSSAALDARCTQVAAFMLAAAALTASLTVNSKLKDISTFIQLIACFMFVAGSVYAFLGIKSSPQHLVGINPSWWHHAIGKEEFDSHDAHIWLAELTEESIAFNCREDDRRAARLNKALYHGMTGGLVLCFSAFVHLL